jgi:serine/threonine-protein kinase
VTKPDGTVERVGAYRVVRRLATGGTSEVLLAEADGTGVTTHTVALKILLPQYGQDAEIRGMFEREAAAYGRLAHPAVVKLFDFFALPPSGPPDSVRPGQSLPRDGQLVMVLELVDGPPLNRLRVMLKAVALEMDDRAALYIAARIFGALAAAHGTTSEDGEPAPVIHRDVNPSNVLVPWDGEVKLADFGIARVTGSTMQSAAGILRGTYGYMAPEQVNGATITPRADVYAAAIVLWELLTKRRAFLRGALPEAEALRAMAEPRLLSIDILRPDIDRSVRDALRRALEPRPERRTITAEEIVSVLDATVPPDAGRENLARLLAQIRHDPRAHAAVEASPRPVSSLPPGEIEAVTPHVPHVGLALARLEPTAPTTTKKMPAVVEPPRAVAPKRQSVTAKIFAQAGGPKADAAPSSDPSTEPTPLAPPIVEIREGSRAVGRAIEDVLRSVPSSMPPSVLEQAGPLTPRVGQLPLAPDPLDASGPSEPSPPTPRMVPLARTMLLGPFTDTGPADLDDRRFAPLAAPLGALAATPAPAPPQAAPGLSTPTPVTPLAGPVAPTSPSAPFTPPALPPAEPTPPPAGVVPPVMTFPEHLAQPPSAPRPASTNPIVAVALVGVVALGIGSTVVYLRLHPDRADRRATASASLPVVPVSAPVSALAPPAMAPPPPVAPPPVTTPTPTPTPAPPSASPQPSTPSSPPPPAVPEGMGMLVTTDAARGRRIFVDEKVVGQTPQSVAVPCGKHTVRLGSAGKPQSIEVPCAGEIVVGDKDK